MDGLDRFVVGRIEEHNVLSMEGERASEKGEIELLAERSACLEVASYRHTGKFKVGVG